MTTPTTLMPLDPAISPQRAARILPIRANLLPDEITSGRSARRTRGVLAAAVLLVLVVLGGWYKLADLDRDQTAADLASVTRSVDDTRDATRKGEYTKVTDVINESQTITGQLTKALADDLPWDTLTSAIRSTGAARRVTITTMTGSLQQSTTPQSPAQQQPAAVGTLTVAGTAPDKNTIAGYVEALAGVKGVANVYLTSVNQSSSGMTFTLTADITSKALCGRFTTGCKSGGK